MSTSFQRRTKQLLAEQKQKGLERHAPPISHRNGAHYRLDGRSVLGFCSNDYLGLASDPVPPLRPLTRGATAARLVAGDDAAQRYLEQCLATLVQMEDCVLFPSGYQANLGALPALLLEGDDAWSDSLNHASIIDGLRLARARRHIVPHLQAPPLPRRDCPGEHWWISESTFSMDGDQPSPESLVAHVSAGGNLYLDEAHTIGLYESGTSFAHRHNVPATVLMAGLGKAFGHAGAFVAASHGVCEWLRTRARSAVFTTAPAPTTVALLQHCHDTITGPIGDERRAALKHNIDLLNDALNGTNHTPIFPLHVGDNDKAVDISAALANRGFHLQAIRPPTVAPGGARLRLTITAKHTETDITSLVNALHDTFDEADIHLRLTTARLDTDMHHSTEPRPQPNPQHGALPAPIQRPSSTRPTPRSTSTDD